MVPVLEAVPNLSAGRDRKLVDRVVQAVSTSGAEVLDASTDADHNRAVVTYVGPPDAVEEAAVAIAHIAVEAIDLRAHEGVHPRVGALDVLPFVPLLGLTMEDARASARRVGGRIGREVGVPVYLYAEAADPPGRSLAELRRGGFEALVRGFPHDRVPDILPEGWSEPGAHPTAGVTCVGARPLLLAWNVEVEGVGGEELRRLAGELRETGGGIRGLRALAMPLRSKGRLQLSMNLEDAWNRRPFLVFREIESRIREAGGRVVSTEVVGMVPEELVYEAGVERLSLLEPGPSRILSPRVVRHVLARISDEIGELMMIVREREGELPVVVRDAVKRLTSDLVGLETWIERR